MTDNNNKNNNDVLVAEASGDSDQAEVAMAYQEVEDVKQTTYFINWDNINTVEEIKALLHEVMGETHFVLFGGVTLEDVGRSKNIWVERDLETEDYAANSNS